jgi:hypothetical protein
LNMEAICTSVTFDVHACSLFLFGVFITEHQTENLRSTIRANVSEFFTLCIRFLTFSYLWLVFFRTL